MAPFLFPSPAHAQNIRGAEFLLPEGSYARNVLHNVSGPTGAGAGMGSKWRSWAELSFFYRDGTRVMSPVFGTARRIPNSMEVDLISPLAFASWKGGHEGVYGNIHLGLSHMKTRGTLRHRIGLAVGIPTADTNNPRDGFTLVLAADLRAGQEAWLWAPDVFPISMPVHLEIGNSAIFMVDAAASVWVPIGERDAAELVFQMAPGLGATLGSSGVFGIRVLTFVIPTEGGDNGRIGLEPFLRFGDAGFLMVRGTVLLDQPNSFTDGVYGVHLGFGGG